VVFALNSLAAGYRTSLAFKISIVARSW